MKPIIVLVSLVGLIAPWQACARSPRTLDPDSLVASLPRTLRSSAPVFVNGMRSDSVQTVTWDGASLFVNGEAIFSARNPHAPSSGAPAPEVPRAKRLGPAGVASKRPAPETLAGDILAPLLGAIESGRVVFVGRGYFLSIPDVSPALEQVERAIESDDASVPGPVSEEILGHVLEAHRK
jgi:hypothetical protein